MDQDQKKTCHLQSASVPILPVRVSGSIIEIDIVLSADNLSECSLGF